MVLNLKAQLKENNTINYLDITIRKKTPPVGKQTSIENPHLLTP